MSKWMLKRTTADIADLARQTGLSPVLARILAVRGYKTAADIKSFITPKLHLGDPLLFADMELALQAINIAIERNNKIAVFGDYDADGIMSTVILYRTFAALGAEVSYYIPSRECEGYGLNVPAIEHLHEQGIQLIVACDNGISAFEEVDYARRLGMEVVILDHHAVFIEEEQGRQVLPSGTAVVDAKRNDCQYPFKDYCAAGLCYRFSEALYAYLDEDWSELGQYLLPFAAIATICDLVDLTGDNRQIVQHGLPEITRSANIGLQSLLAACELQNTAIDAYHVGFILGPCINASGRLETAGIAVELFLTNDLYLAQQNARLLAELNSKRKTLTETGTQLAIDIVEKEQLADKKVIVIYCQQILESVAGIVAGKIKEKYHRPTIVIAGDKDILHGSCRSIEGYNIFEGLKSCQQYLVTFGGHPMAAGLSIEASQITLFAKAINDLCQLTEDDFEEIYRIDCQLPPTCATLSLAKQLMLLAPYGKGNPRPLFACKNLALDKITLLGKEGRVMRLLLRDDAGHMSEAIDFSSKDILQKMLNDIDDSYWLSLTTSDKNHHEAHPSVRLDIIYSLNVNIFNGKESAQLQIVDLRISQ